MEKNKYRNIWECIGSVDTLSKMLRVLYWAFTGGAQLGDKEIVNKAHLAEILNFIENTKKYSSANVDDIISKFNASRQFPTIMRQLIYSANLAEKKRRIEEVIDLNIQASVDQDDLLANIAHEYTELPTKLHEILFLNLLYQYIEDNVSNLNKTKRTVQNKIKRLILSLQQDEYNNAELYDMFDKLYDLFNSDEDITSSTASKKSIDNKEDRYTEMKAKVDELKQIGVEDNQIMKSVLNIYTVLRPREYKQLLNILKDIYDKNKTLDNILSKHQGKHLSGTKRYFRIRFFAHQTEYRIIFQSQKSSRNIRVVKFIDTREKATKFYKGLGRK